MSCGDVIRITDPRLLGKICTAGLDVKLYIIVPNVNDNAQPNVRKIGYVDGSDNHVCLKASFDLNARCLSINVCDDDAANPRRC